MSLDSSAKFERKSVIDLRSDFLSRPTPAMIEAMVHASRIPGDFDSREDPTVRRLEALAAEVLGKQDALFVPTCMMANQIAIHLHCRPGEGFVTEAEAHVVTSESDAASALSGAMPIQIPAVQGALDADALTTAIESVDRQHGRPVMVLQENTHVRSGGRVVSLDHMARISDIASTYGAVTHLDGARLFNAAVSLDRPARDLAAQAQTVAFNLNKGLGAPIGAILAGSSSLVTEAVRVRQMFGGNWRPAGIPAAAGIVALNTMIDRLIEDHARAGRLAKGISAIGGIRTEEESTETNIVLAEPITMTPEAFVGALSEKGILTLPFGHRVRFVTHYEVTDDGIDQVLSAIRGILNGEKYDSQVGR